MGYKTASTRFTQARSAQSSDLVAFNNAATGNASISGTSLTANSVITTVTVIPGANAGTGTTTITGGGGAGTTISSIVYTNSAYSTLAANAAATTFGYARILGSGFTAAANIFLSNNTVNTNTLINVTANTTFVNSGEIRANLPNTSIGSYTLYVFNSSGSAAIYYSGINFEPYPLWNTPSSLSSGNVTVTIPLAGYVTSTSNVQPITFSLAAGNTLPSGLTLNSNGVLTGTTVAVSGGVQTFYFYVNATDLYNETTTSGNIALTLSAYDPQFTSTTMLLNGETTNTSFIADASSNNTAVTIVGNTRPTLTTPYLGDGYYSNLFDGSSGYLTLGTPSALQVGSNNFTIEAWIFPMSTGKMLLLGNLNDGTGSGSYWLIVNSVFNGGSLLQLGYNSSSTGYNIQVGTGTLTTYTWHHVAVSRSGSNTYFFLDGAQVGATNTSIGSRVIDSNSNTFYIGYAVSGSYYINGYVSNLRLVNGAALYTANFTPSTTSLTSVANTALLTSQSTSIVDKSANNLAITKNGTVNISPASPFATPSSITANIGYSVYFNGTSTSAGSSLSGTLSTTIGNSNFTIEGWVYHTALYNYMDWFSITRGTTGFNIGTDSSGIVVMYYNGARQIASSSGVIATNTWYHFAFVRNGATITAYINGTGVGSTTTSTNSNFTASGFFIGSLDNTQEYMPGYISNLRLVVGTAVYTSNFTPPTAPLTAIANTTLLTCQGNAIVDASSNALTLTPTGNVKVVNNTYPFTVPTATVSNLSKLSATYFSGTADYLTAAPGSQFAFGTSNYTVEMWVYPTVAGKTMCLFDTRAVGTSASGVALAINSSNQPYVYVNATTLFTSTTVIALNSWTHIAMVKVSGTIYLYMNGTQVGSAASATSCTDTYCTIASTVDYRDATTTLKFAGYLSDVRVVNGTALYTATFAPTYQPLTAVANTSLLTLQNNGGATNGGFADNSEFNNIITRAGTTAQGTFSPYSQMGWSNLFNGSTDYLTVPTGAFVFGTNNFTVECWVYTSAYGTGQIAIDNWLNAFGSYANGMWQLWLNSSGTLAFSYATGASTYTAIGTGTVPINQWTHIAAVRNGTTLTVYLNGVASGSGTLTVTSIGIAGSGSIGRQTSGNTYFWNGYISNARVVNGTAVYTTNFTPSTTPLTAVSGTAVLTCQSNRFKDNSTNNYTITPTGTPSAQAFTPFSPGVIYSPTTNGGSAYFNGSTDYLTVPSTTTLQGIANRNMTIEFWVNFSSTWSNTNYNLIQKGRTGTSDYEWGVYLTGSASGGTAGVISWQPQSGGSGTSNGTYNSSTVNIYASTWNHIAISVSGTTVYFFLNGVAAGTASVTLSSFTGAGALSVANNNNGSNAYFPGYISDVRITPGTAVYTTAFTPPTAPLTNYANSTPATLLLNFNNGGIVDQHGSFNFATVGNIQTSTSTVKYGTRSLQFTGTSGAYLQSFQSLPALQWWLGSYTVEYWIYANAFTTGGNGESTVLGCLGATGTSTYWAFGPIAGGTVRWYYYNGSAQTLTTSTTLSTGQWYHLAFVNNAGALTIYINGVSSATGTISGTPQAVATLPVTLGSSNNVSFNGYLDDVRITKYARYTGNFTPPTISDIAQ